MAGRTGCPGRAVAVRVKTNLYNYTEGYHGRDVDTVWYLVPNSLYFDRKLVRNLDNFLYLKKMV